MNPESMTLRAEILPLTIPAKELTVALFPIKDDLDICETRLTDAVAPDIEPTIETFGVND